MPERIPSRERSPLATDRRRSAALACAVMNAPPRISGYADPVVDVGHTFARARAERVVRKG